MATAAARAALVPNVAAVASPLLNVGCTLAAAAATRAVAHRARAPTGKGRGAVAPVGTPASLLVELECGDRQSLLDAQSAL